MRDVHNASRDVCPLCAYTGSDNVVFNEIIDYVHRFGSKLNRTVLNSCGNPIIRSAKTRDFCAELDFCANRAIHTKKEAKKGS